MYIYNINDEFINKILYVGAGTHISPIKDFFFTKEFIFVDTKPRSICETKKEFDINNYDRNFIKNLINECEKNDMKLKFIIKLDKKYKNKIFNIKEKIRYLFNCPKYLKPHLFIFYNESTGQTLKYYISTNIEYNMLPELEKEIEESKAVIVSNYFPKTKLLDYFQNLKIFIGYVGTNFGLNLNDILCEEKRNTILCMLNMNKENVNSIFFYTYYLITSNKNQKIEFDSYEELVNKSKMLVK
jgi:hypothetical protein